VGSTRFFLGKGCRLPICHGGPNIPHGGSGADFGYCSAKCEEWFQTRLTEIRDGKKWLRAVGTWKNALSFQRKTKLFLHANEELAAKYLAGCPVL
jgi:hypothetical protein